MKIQIYTTAVPILIALCSCSAPSENREDLEEIKQEIIAAEKSFSEYSEKNGFAKALAEYAADDVIKLNHNQYPTIGKAQLQKEAAQDSIGSSQGTLTWKPLKVWVAESGDMATAFGDWYYTAPSHQASNDTTLYGNYVTVWMKQKDGSWKFAIDGGNRTPGPTPDVMLETF